MIFNLLLSSVAASALVGGDPTANYFAGDFTTIRTVQTV